MSGLTQLSQTMARCSRAVRQIIRQETWEQPDVLVAERGGFDNNPCLI
ncbi:MAG: hypothetical protein V7K60_34710 [Nostoc sp.]